MWKWKDYFVWYWEDEPSLPSYKLNPQQGFFSIPESAEGCRQPISEAVWARVIVCPVAIANFCKKWLWYFDKMLKSSKSSNKINIIGETCKFFANVLACDFDRYSIKRFYYLDLSHRKIHIVSSNNPYENIPTIQHNVIKPSRNVHYKYNTPMWVNIMVSIHQDPTQYTKSCTLGKYKVHGTTDESSYLVLVQIPQITFTFCICSMMYRGPKQLVQGSQ